MMKKINSILKDFITSGFLGGYEEESVRKAVVINLFSLVGILFLLLFGIKTLLLNMILHSFIVLLICAITLLNLIILRVKKKYFFASYALVIIFFFLVIFLFITGGEDSTGFLWCYIYPVIAFFTIGRKKGFIVIIIFYLTFLILFTTKPSFMVEYSLNFMLRFIGSMISISLLTYIFEFIREKTYLEMKLANTKSTEYINQVLQQKEEIMLQRDLLNEANNKLIQTNLELEKLSTVACKTNNAVIIADKDGKIEWVNDGFINLFGYSKEEYIKVFGENIIESKNIKVDKNSIFDVKETIFIESEKETKSGNKIWVHSTFTPVFNERGNLINIVIIKSDITKLKRAEEEIIQQKEEIFAQKEELEKMNLVLEQRVQEEIKINRDKEIMLIQQSRQAIMGEMIANIAHQWRQPLNALGVIIQNFQEAYEYQELNEDYIRKKSEKSMEIIHYMSKTIDDFRNFFKTDKTKQEFEIKLIVNKAVSFLEAAFKNNNIKIDYDFKDNLKIVGYPNEYAQVVLNIINNAKDLFIEKNIDNPTLKISLEKVEDKSVLTIADNAGGIPENIKDKIFDPYFTTKDSNKGTGLGLYMSKTIIEKNMNGKLYVENFENGAKFFIKV